MNLTRGLIAAVFAMFCASVMAQNKLKQGNAAAAAGDWLLARQGPKWWYDMVAQRLGGRWVEMDLRDEFLEASKFRFGA